MFVVNICILVLLITALRGVIIYSEYVALHKLIQTNYWLVEMGSLLRVNINVHNCRYKL